VPDALRSLVHDMRLELFFQLALSVLLGGTIGLERELRNKPAGLRTNVLICMGATMFTALSIYIPGGHGDPGRIAAQVLTGVGFIGAGTILHLRGSVTGLTSAATIWVVTAIGMAVGARAYVEAIGATALVGVVLVVLGRAERLLASHATRSRLTVHLRPEPSAVEELEVLVRATGIEIVKTASRMENVDLVVEMDLSGPKQLHDQAMLAIVHHPGVRSVSTGE